MHDAEPVRYKKWKERNGGVRHMHSLTSEQEQESFFSGNKRADQEPGSPA